MTDLTPEDRAQIYREEKARLELEAEAANNAEHAEKARSKNKHGCLILILIAMAFATYAVFQKEKSDRYQAKLPTLRADIRTNGTQVILKNNDSYEWTNIKIEINAGLGGGRYYFNLPLIQSKETATIELLNFSSSQGERFNPLLTKVLKIYISANTEKGFGSYTGEWK